MVRPVALVFFVLLLIPFSFSQVSAADLFTVAGVDVDVTADSAEAARKQALKAGEGLAFERLLKRLTLKADRERLPRLKPGEIAPFVRDFQVSEEKSSPVRYLAKLTFHFKAPLLRDLLRDYGLEFAETPSKPVLLLPVFRSLGVVSLWDDPNPWRRVWKGAEKSSGLVPLRLPRGDLTDIATIGAEQAVSGDKQRLEALVRRHKVSDVMVALAVMGANRKGLRQVRITLDRYNRQRDDQRLELALDGAPGEALDLLLGRAQIAVRDGIEEMWKRDNILRFDSATVLAVTLPIRSLLDWVEAKKRLGVIAVIQRLDLVLISRDEVRINLHHIGEVEQLSLALAQADMVLAQEERGWILGLQGRANSGQGRGIPIRPKKDGA